MTPRLGTRVAIAALIAAGCNKSTELPEPIDEPHEPAPASLVGMYTLRTLNGNELPAVQADNAGGRLEVLSDFYDLKADWTWSRTQHYRRTLPGGSPTEDSYSLTGTYVSSYLGLRFDGVSSGVSYYVGATHRPDTLTFSITVPERITRVFVRLPQ